MSNQANAGGEGAGSARGDNVPVIDADDILDGILAWVDTESPSHDGESVNRMVSQV